MKCLLVIGDVEVEVADVRGIFREDDVASELAWCEPEGKIWNIVELEFCMNPAEGEQKEKTSWLKSPARTNRGGQVF